MRCLQREPKNTCPFTKKKLTRRELVILTPENVDEYRGKIVHATLAEDARLAVAEEKEEEDSDA